MKKVEIKYNPFTKTTEILVGGTKPKVNSKLNFGEKRLQEWAGDLSDILVEEYQDRNFSIKFMGTLADYEDLKSGLSTPQVEINIEHFKCTPSVSETEAEVDNIFEEIKNGPVAQLRDETIIQAFNKAKDQRFEINVVATMSSGKSTLINALLDYELMPVANTATTATIVNIIDTDREKGHFRGTAFDSGGEQLFVDNGLSLETMEKWNKDEQISSINIEGRIPCVNSVGMRLVLVDTPGPNNSGDKRHKTMTYEMMNDSDKSLVLFVMNGTQLDTDDETVFFDYICDCMQKRGKQSRDRFIFVVNKLDSFNPIKESIEESLVKVRTKLEARKIYEPNIFPASALAAFEARTTPEVTFVIDNFKKWINKFPNFHFDSYYKFSHLPNLIKLELEKYLREAENEPDKEKGEATCVEIHSGIVSIEKAIELYINKYARPIKVYDLVQSFNNRLRELAAIATLEQEIKENTKKKKQLDKSIDIIRGKIQSGESAKQLSTLVENIDMTESVQKEIDGYINTQSTKINKIIFKYTNSSKIKKTDAEKQAKEIVKESKDILEQLAAQIDRILSNTYALLIKTIVAQYESFVKDLGITMEDNCLALNPLVFIGENIADLSSVLKKKTTKVTVAVGQHTEKETVSEPYQHKLTNWFWRPSTWGTKRYETRYRDVIKTKTVIDYDSIEYVNMKDVVVTYFEPIQIQLVKAKDSAMDHVAAETKRIKGVLNEQLKQINETLDKKLEELQQTINAADTTEKELETKKKNLEWMNGIIARINKLINF
ncbi:MAG: dynamin family protein [Prevotella sp.]|nr:dynamin family protein [Prevotella sp.]